MKYILIDVKGGDMFTEEFDDREKALERADAEWNHLSNHDKSKREAFYLLETENPDTLDGDIIKTWR